MCDNTPPKIASNADTHLNGTLLEYLQDLHLREPVQGKCWMEHVDRSRWEQPAVERPGHSGGEVGAVVVGGEALLHAAGAVGGQGWEELEESVEVVAWEIGEEGRELGRLDPEGFKPLGDVLDDDVDDVDGVVAAGATQVDHHEGDFWGGHELDPV